MGAASSQRRPDFVVQVDLVLCFRGSNCCSRNIEFDVAPGSGNAEPVQSSRNPESHVADDVAYERHSEPTTHFCSLQ